MFGLPIIKISKDKLCGTFQMGKQMIVSFKSKKVVLTSKPLELLHLDLFDPLRTRSLGGNHYRFVIIDNYYRFTWTLFLTHKDATFKAFVDFAKLVRNVFNLKIFTLHSDHGGEFVNHQFQNFCTENEIAHNFSCPRTPQQNGVVKRKNLVFEELARTMISEMSIPK